MILPSLVFSCSVNKIFRARMTYSFKWRNLRFSSAYECQCGIRQTFQKNFILVWIILSMRGYQLTVSATRWQHWSQIGHNFYLVKNHKITNNSTNTEARENKHIFGILRILEKNLMYVWLNLKTIKFYLIKLATDY